YSLILASYVPLLKHKQVLVAGLAAYHYPVRIFTDNKSKSFTWHTHFNFSHNVFNSPSYF
ncbi:MAG: hypothetical protein KJ569_02900, partial [Candidatus Omnitrophica bacterium]|nr:hypothetical protein [Candidatus Omnitrophota bacterium]